MGGAAPVLTNEKAQLLDVIDRLQNTLMDVSDIFNLAVQPYHLFVLALRMIQFSELSDPQRVATLWKSLIYRFDEVIEHSLRQWDYESMHMFVEWCP
jgi:hypothetical protein